MHQYFEIPLQNTNPVSTKRFSQVDSIDIFNSNCIPAIVNIVNKRAPHSRCHSQQWIKRKVRLVLLSCGVARVVRFFNSQFFAYPYDANDRIAAPQNVTHVPAHCTH